MKTTEELTERLRGMGCKNIFKPIQESESGAVLLQVRRPADIVGGRLVGSGIDIYNPSTFRVWTPHTKKAKACAARYGLRIRLVDGECELFIPAHLADKLLPEFGAMVKRVISDKAMVHLKAIGFKKHTQEPSCKGLPRPEGS